MRHVGYCQRVNQGTYMLAANAHRTRKHMPRMYSVAHRKELLYRHGLADGRVVQNAEETNHHAAEEKPDKVDRTARVKVEIGSLPRW